MNDYETRKQLLSEQIKAAADVRLGKSTSNLFRARQESRGKILNVRDFNHVLKVNPQEAWAEVEGMATYEDFVAETLKHGLMPAVVPQLKTITIGGAVSGGGIESSSFRYGLVHETVLEMEILLASGHTVICSPQENSDLFYGFATSYGTFGYALKLKVKLVPVKPFVKLEHFKFSNFVDYFRELERACKSDSDFVDGVIFSPGEMYITTGRFIEQAPYASDYTYLSIFYKSIREKQIDYLTTHDYLWRWDTDWFWCSKAIYAQNPTIRRLLGPKRLNSRFYNKLMHWDNKWGFSEMAHKLVGKQREKVIQDVDIPIENSPKFAEFFFRQINIRPVWVCPIGSYNKNVKFSLYPLDPNRFYVNFGFWDALPGKKEKGYYNKQVEAKVTELAGRKGLYSDAYYTEDEFWKIYDRQTYDRLKAKYDPSGKLKNLYDKCVKKL